MVKKQKKQEDEVERVNFTTSIDAELLHKFRIYCATENVYQNDVLEKLIGKLLKKRRWENG